MVEHIYRSKDYNLGTGSIIKKDSHSQNAVIVAIYPEEVIAVNEERDIWYYSFENLVKDFKVQKAKSISIAALSDGTTIGVVSMPYKYIANERTDVLAKAIERLYAEIQNKKTDNHLTFEVKIIPESWEPIKKIFPTD